MAVTVHLSLEEEAQLLEQAQRKGLSAEALARQAIQQLLTGSPTGKVKGPKKSFRGLLADLGPAPSEEEINENRREMFAGADRDDQT
jgi:hypothetical protein